MELIDYIKNITILKGTYETEGMVFIVEQNTPAEKRYLTWALEKPIRVSYNTLEPFEHDFILHRDLEHIKWTL